MNAKVVIPCLSTGVPGLDTVLGGGLPELSFNLIGGTPGCGKTTLAHQIMFALATPTRSALYFTALGEPPLKMLRYQQQFDFFDGDAVNRSVRYIDLSDDALGGDLQRVLQRITDEVARHEPGLVFVDSFRAMMLSSREAENAHGSLHQFVRQLGVLMTSWQATTFLIGEFSEARDATPVFSVADGLIWLHQTLLRDSMVRKLEIVKMRGRATLPGLHTFRISERGVQVFAPIVPGRASDEAAHAGVGDRLRIGLPDLDAMLGGGLPRGFSLLVAGPSGSGKSVLASAFLAEGARNGETGVIAVFEQRPNQARNLEVARLIERGIVSLVDNRAPDLSIDEILLLLVTEVRRLKATRVVIDSLSGFELALAPVFRQDFRESLARLVSALATEGVTVLMTSELEDRYNDLRFSPYGTAFLTDSIIVLRYIEVESRLRRMIAVVKLRGSAHSDELREFSIDGDGIRIGAMLTDQEGLLGGRPRRRVVPGEPHGGAEGDHE